MREHFLCHDWTPYLSLRQQPARKAMSFVRLLVCSFVGLFYQAPDSQDQDARRTATFVDEGAPCTMGLPMLGLGVGGGGYLI